MRHIYYLVVTKNEIMSFVGKWMELEKLILSQVTRPRKTNTALFLSLEAPTSKSSDVNT